MSEAWNALVGCLLIVLVGALMVGVVLAVTWDLMMVCPLAVLGVFGLIARSLFGGEDDE